MNCQHMQDFAPDLLSLQNARSTYTDKKRYINLNEKMIINSAEVPVEMGK